MYRDRGWAWSRALLGLPAKEVHLCGNDSALDIITTICHSTGEKLEVLILIDIDTLTDVDLSRPRFAHITDWHPLRPLPLS